MIIQAVHGVLSIFPTIVCHLSGEVCKHCYYEIPKLGGMGFDDKGHAQKGMNCHICIHRVSYNSFCCRRLLNAPKKNQALGKY